MRLCLSVCLSVTSFRSYELERRRNPMSCGRLLLTYMSELQSTTVCAFMLQLHIPFCVELFVRRRVIKPKHWCIYERSLYKDAKLIVRRLTVVHSDNFVTAKQATKQDFRGFQSHWHIIVSNYLAAHARWCLPYCDDSRSFNRSFSVQISEGTFLLRAH